MRTSVMTAIALAAAAGTASADTRHFTGQQCIGDSLLVRNFEGCSGMRYAPSGSCSSPTSFATAMLPISGHSSRTVDLDSVEVTLRDGSDETEIACEVVITTTTGAVHWSGSAGSGIQATGYRTLVWSGANLPNGGEPIQGVASYHVSCRLPHVWIGDSMNGTCHAEEPSYVSSYAVREAAASTNKPR